MAITRTQIARQLYRIGGVGGRAEEGPVERGGGGDRDGVDGIRISIENERISIENERIR